MSNYDFFGSRVVMKGVIEFQVHLLIVFLNKQKNRLYVYKLYLPINLLNLIEVITKQEHPTIFPLFIERPTYTASKFNDAPYICIAP